MRATRRRSTTTSPPARPPSSTSRPKATPFTGIGIEKDRQPLIFEDFTQASYEIGMKYGGTGLGLSISRKLVEMHGGRLWAESTGVEGEGSTFYVELPLEARIVEVIEN